MDNFRLVGRHPESLASGVIVSPGDKVPLSNEDQEAPENARLIAEGRLRLINANRKKAKAVDQRVAAATDDGGND